jgi:uncharacterized protein
VKNVERQDLTPSRILDQRAHRPWPMPTAPWVMTQSWHDLLFAHWTIDPALLAPHVPAALTLDLYEDQAWVGVVPFRMTNVAPRGLALPPSLSAFPELNVRTYVRVGRKPGVYFFSLDCSNLLAVLGARWVFLLPYHHATMRLDRTGQAIRFGSRRVDRTPPAADLAVRYEPVGPVFHAAPGTLEHFLTERYRLYTTDARGRVFHVDIHHPPWPLQQARAEFAVNTMTAANRLPVHDHPPRLHVAARQDIVGWPIRRWRGDEA